MKTIIKHLEKYVSMNHIGREYALDAFLDFLIDFFDVKHFVSGWKQHINDTAVKNPILMAAAMEWMHYTALKIEENGWYDSLGHLYEDMYQSRNKASSLGQFFTPDALCDAMASLQVNCQKTGEVINDSACGSGRTLLAYFSKTRKGFYIGEDIDSMSVRMCTLNLMIHGACGRTLCHDALAGPHKFLYGYEINEIRYPFPSIFYSVRKITQDKGYCQRKTSFLI